MSISALPAPLLVTTFDTWLPHQVSNASDDLVCLWQSSHQRPREQSQSVDTAIGRHLPEIHVIHRLPVNAELACSTILRGIEQYRPSCVILCGMAESRQRLSLELRAVSEGGDRFNDKQSVYWTPIPLTALCTLRRSLKRTALSYDAGRFVCNATYYHLLKHHHETPEFPDLLFLHVPPLTAENRSDLLEDFRQLLRFTASL